MTSLSIAHGGSTPQDRLDTIRSVLKTQVSDILRLNITQLSTLPPDTVYDRILNTPQLLHECFQVFRLQPDLFKRVVVRQDKHPVASDLDLLWCGRTVADVVKLVVRASAKRYFRATLPAPPRPKAPPPPSLLHQAAVRLRLKQQQPKAPKAPLGQGDRLYQAFRENLLFEWQVPLIPHYTPLEASIVTRLGSRILALREPAQIRILATEGLTPEGHLPLLLDNAKRLRGPDQGIDANALTEAFGKLELEGVFPALEDTHLRRAVSQIACMDPRVTQLLIPALETDLRSVTIFLFAAFSRLGEKGFRQAFGSHGAMWAVQKLAKHLETCRPWPRSLPGMKQASERALAFAVDLDTGLPAKDKLKTPDPGPAPSASANPAAAPARAARTPTVASSAPSRR
ncbi:MAG: hypothetical protein EPN20_05415 [Magnetospirillum sp.]|nr:MAG: hypothetical protein EPN20_05415 [Magnetospirillum sp.]